MRKKIITILLTVLLIVSQTACGGKGEDGENNPGASRTNFVLDTICTITVYALDNSGGRYKELGMDGGDIGDYMGMLIEGTFDQISLYESALSSTIEGSFIWNINHAGGEPVPVSADTINVIKKGLEYCELSGGAFDITCGTETSLWDFRGNAEADEPVVPDAADLREAAKHVDYTKVVVDEQNMTVQLLDPEMQLDLGGIAKGYIADRAAVFLEDNHVKSAVVDLGGNIVVINGKSEKKLVDVEHEGLEFPDFTVGVKNPLSKKGELLGTINMNNETVVTSGTYERCFEVDGVKYHHILDPETGYPVDTDVEQVSVISRRNGSVDCDGLSTSCLALGLEKGMKLIEEQPDYVRAVFLGTDGKVYTSKGCEFKKK